MSIKISAPGFHHGWTLPGAGYTNTVPAIIRQYASRAGIAVVETAAGRFLAGVDVAALHRIGSISLLVDQPCLATLAVNGEPVPDYDPDRRWLPPPPRGLFRELRDSICGGPEPAVSLVDVRLLGDGPFHIDRRWAHDLLYEPLPDPTGVSGGTTHPGAPAGARRFAVWPYPRAALPHGQLRVIRRLLADLGTVRL